MVEKRKIRVVCHGPCTGNDVTVLYFFSGRLTVSGHCLCPNGELTFEPLGKKGEMKYNKRRNEDRPHPIRSHHQHPRAEL